MCGSYSCSYKEVLVTHGAKEIWGAAVSNNRRGFHGTVRLTLKVLWWEVPNASREQAFSVSVGFLAESWLLLLSLITFPIAFLEV